MPFRVESQAEPIPGYKLVERLGGGGFGEVWKAEAPGGIFKAIKFVFGNLESTGEEDEVRARQELKALNRVKDVRHPYILSLERYDIIDGQLMIVMELADKNLWDRFKECRAQGQLGIPRDEMLRYMEESAEALDLMNIKHQLQHLDIKPQNIFLVYNHVKVADFGLVKDLEGMKAAVTGGITPVYAAPETFEGEVTRFCDQYSLGIVYQELLTGRRPFAGNNVQQLIMQHLTGKPNLEPLPASDREAIARALAKKPAERFASCGDLVRALRSGVVTSASVTGTPLPEAQSALGSMTARRETEDISRTPPLAKRAAEDVERTQTGARREFVATAEKAAVILTPPPPEPVRPKRTAPPEETGEGILFPSVVIGVGGAGLAVLQQLRESLTNRVGPAAVVPHIRLLYIDTDPDVLKELPSGGENIITQSDCVLARLNRPTHYLGLSNRLRIESWIDNKVIYKIPRQPVTTGIRALGRLALVDNYRLVLSRIQSELEAATEPEALPEAGNKTRLGLRTNRPRVYIVAGLGGGTGGGMFLDLGYIVRNLLKMNGYEQPDVVGVGLLPTVEAKAQRGSLAVGNTYAALVELNHFASSKVAFSAVFDEREQQLFDTGTPFQRLALLSPSVEDNSPKALRDMARLAGEFLGREVAAPLGKIADEVRATFRAAPAGLGYTCQTIGLYQYTWPRHVLHRRVARSLCQHLVRKWMSKDRTRVREPVAAALAEERPNLDITTEWYIEQLQKACAEVLGKDAQALFADVLSPLEMAARPTSSFLFKRVPDLNPSAVHAVLEQFEQIVGRPEEQTTTTRKAPTIPDILPGALKPLLAAAEQKVRDFASRFLERPDLRLAAAEESILQIQTELEQSQQRYEIMCQELASFAANAYSRINGRLSALVSGENRRGTFTTEVIEMLRSYPKWRYQSLVLRQVIQGFAKLQTYLTDLLREVDFCRGRLNDLCQSLDDSSRGDTGVPMGQFTAALLPGGGSSVSDAIDKVLADITPEEMRDLDNHVQAMINGQFTTLKHVCQSSGVLMRNLERALVQEAEPLATERLKDANIVDMFFLRYSDETAIASLTEAFRSARPHLAGEDLAPEEELRLLAVPPGSTTDHFRDLVKHAVPDAELTAAPSIDDIVIYRECVHTPIDELPQVGPEARQAYDRMQSTPDQTAHARNDIVEWEPLGHNT
jgi:hypothetical protein